MITGFPSKDLLSESDRCGVLQLLEKPFALEELKSAVTNASLAEKSPGRVSPLAGSVSAPPNTEAPAIQPAGFAAR